MTMAASLTRPVRSLFQVQAGEGPVVALMIVYSASAVGGVLTIGFNGVGQALFLSRLPASAVPFTFILPAIVIVLTLAAYARLAPRIPLPRLAAGSSALLLLLAVVFRVLLALGLGTNFGVLAAIYLYCEAAGSLVLVQFWTFAGQIFNPRQARRLFGLMAAGGTVSSAAAGLILVLLTHAIGVDNLILIVAASCGVCAVCPLLLREYTRTGSGGSQTSAASGVRTTLYGSMRDLWRTPLLRSIGLLTVLVSLLINIGAFQFFLVLQSTYTGRSAALAGFLGAFSLWTGLAALAIQLFGTGPVMVRFGVFVAQAILPLAIAGAAGAVLLAWGALWIVALMRGLDPALRRTVHDASLNALYLPLPAEQRQRARAMLEGVYAVSFGLAGAVFLLVQRTSPEWTYQYWSIPVLFLSVCWIGVLFAARRQYVSALADSLDRRRLRFHALSPDLADETTMRVLVRALSRSDDRVVVHVLDLIAETPCAPWLAHVVPLLGHPSPQVRVTALRCVQSAGNSAHVGAAARLLTAPEDDVTCAAVEAVAGLTGSHAADLVAPLLADVRPNTAAAAVTVMMRHGDNAQSRAAAERLWSMLESDDASMRRAASRVLGSLAGAGSRLVATGALTSIASPGRTVTESPSDQLANRLVDQLRDRNVRDVAAESLALHGEAAVPALALALGDRREETALRMRAAAILQRIGGSAAAKALLDACGDPDPKVRVGIARALADPRVRESMGATDGSLLAARIVDEVTECYRLRLWIEDLRPARVGGLLVEALHDRMRDGLDCVFFLLQAQYRAHDLVRAHVSATSADEAGKAIAAEMLDSVVDRRIGALLLPLLEGKGERVVGVAVRDLGMIRKPAHHRIAELAEGDDPWLRACAIFQIGRAPDAYLTTLALGALNDGNDLVRETALGACLRILDEDHVAQLAAAQLHEASLPVTRRYAQALVSEIGSA